MGREGKNWRGLEPGDDVLTACDKTHPSQRYLQAAEDLRCCSWCNEQIFEDRESFLLQRKCAMSASVEIIFFWAWLIILVWENEPKLKETTVNYFESRHHQSIEEYTRDNSELVNQDARIVWASLISSLEVYRYDCLFQDCPLAGNTRRLLEILSVVWFGNLWCSYLQCRFF